MTGHALDNQPEDQPAFSIGHADDPKNGHLVRIHFDDPEEERAFIERLERERPVAAG